MMILQMEVVRGTHRVATVTMDSYVDAAKIIRLPFNLVILRKALRSQRICPICC